MATDMVYSNIEVFFTGIYAIYAVLAAIIATFMNEKKIAAIYNLILSCVITIFIWIGTSLFQIAPMKPVLLMWLFGVFIVRDMIAIAFPKGNYSAVVIALTLVAGVLLYFLSDSIKYMVLILPLWIEIMVYDVSNIKDMPVLMTGWSFIGIIMLLALGHPYAAIFTIVVFIISMIGYFKHHKMSALNDMSEWSKNRQKKKIEAAIKKRNKTSGKEAK